jgi:hypothetical protein
MSASVEKMFPRDEFNPHTFNKEERDYLLTHLGETPRQAFNKEIPAYPANREGMVVALQRLFEDLQDQPELKPKLLQSLELANETDKIKNEERSKYGGINYSAMGVGVGPGETGLERHFVVALASKIMRAAGDPLARLRSAFQGEGADEAPEEQALGLSSLPCAWCETTGTGVQAFSSLQTHVRRSHPDHYTHFKEVIAPALKAGDIGPLQDALEVHDKEMSMVAESENDETSPVESTE